MEADVRELSPLYGKQLGQRIEGRRIVKRYDAPKVLVFMLLGVIRLLISLGG
jgi:hypothetical protein